ncbi:AAA family ATPase [Undibacterium sp. 5I1]|uniref:AAA family ATPase n=1 Tax=unclassified Undibacterium TaxID=2630295 RepID=UPI002AB43D5B|nr:MULTISPECIES: AAA family ATPase [unclassified Undibacterium]MDY7537857.1 AAA family ATPase [Undibacterium sp. 5I1]MEB0232313.1 AAA family ATPase [Undibacterium sp. 10I3]MEB0259118.1 AAA family ATPase [Undibacterium sp. 5I1]
MSAKSKSNQSIETRNTQELASAGVFFGKSSFEEINLTFPFESGYTLAQRDELLMSHPIRQRTYTIPTIALERTYDLIRDRVWSRRTGVCFYGTSRVGKTVAAEYVEDRLKEEFETTFVSRLSAREAPRPKSNGHMPRLLLDARKHILAGRQKDEDLYRNAVTDTIMEVRRLKGALFVLIVDEMQLLSSHDLQQLLVIQNALAMEKIRSVTVSFAQPEIMERRTAMKATHQMQLIARFLSEPIAYEACTTVEELKVILEVYDVSSEYPINSGWSYTCFFLPQAFSRGFRLASYAPPIWQAVCDAAIHMGGDRVPMEHLSMTIEHILLAGYSNDSPNYILSKIDIELAVQASNLEMFGA